MLTLPDRSGMSLAIDGVPLSMHSSAYWFYDLSWRSRYSVDSCVKDDALRSRKGWSRYVFFINFEVDVFQMFAALMVLMMTIDGSIHLRLVLLRRLTRLSQVASMTFENVMDSSSMTKFVGSRLRNETI